MQDKILQDFHAREDRKRLHVDIGLNECMDVGLGQLNKRVLTSRQFGVTGPFDEPEQKAMSARIKDYIVYKMPLGVWVAAYVVLALIVVSLLK